MTTEETVVTSPLSGTTQFRTASPSNPNLPFVDKSQIRFGYFEQATQVDIGPDELVIIVRRPPHAAKKAAMGQSEKTDLDPRWSSTQVLRFVHTFAAREEGERGGSGPEDFEHLPSGITSGLQLIMSLRDPNRVASAATDDKPDAEEAPAATEGATIPADAV